MINSAGSQAAETVKVLFMEQLMGIHEAQLLTAMKLANIKQGFLF